MFVCSCKGVTDRTIKAAIDAGARTVDDLTAHCSAGGRCRGCWPMLAKLLAQHLEDDEQQQQQQQGAAPTDGSASACHDDATGPAPAATKRRRTIECRAARALESPRHAVPAA